MDTGETYIKICEKAEEIQAIRRDRGFIYGDYYYEPISRNWNIIYDSQKSYMYSMPMCIWLPRQDQLQEILFIHKEHLFPQCVLLKEFIKENELYIVSFLKSMEQLWLAFVMYKKYNKVWNGENWIKEIE